MLGAPSNLNVTAVSSRTGLTNTTLAWTDNSSNETGFKIERSTSSSSGFVQIATVGANVTTFTFTGAFSSTVYYYRVRAYNAEGDSAYSNIAWLPAASVPPNAPSRLAAGSATTGSLTLTWADNSSNESGFKIERSTSASSGFAQIATVGADVTTYTNAGLSASTLYYYRVRAYNTVGDSAYSNTASGQTLATSQTVTLAAVASNCAFYNSLNSTVANTVYGNCRPAVGINSYWSMSGIGDVFAAAGAVLFNVSALSGKTIESATLNVEAASLGVGYYPRSFRIGAIASSWSASTLTWNRMSSLLFYNASWMNFLHPTFVGQDYAINLRVIVQNWANGTYANHGIGFQAVDYTSPGNVTSLDAYDFYVPTLTVTYH